jgi:hypothetical protein
MEIGTHINFGDLPPYLTYGMLCLQHVLSQGIPGLRLEEGVDPQALSFLYPYGATLNVARPAVPVLSTGSVSFPQVQYCTSLFCQIERKGRKVSIESELFELYRDYDVFQIFEPFFANWALKFQKVLI